jgi:hypothetical protein
METQTFRKSTTSSRNWTRHDMRVDYAHQADRAMLKCASLPQLKTRALDLAMKAICQSLQYLDGSVPAACSKLQRHGSQSATQLPTDAQCEARTTWYRNMAPSSARSVSRISHLPWLMKAL